MESINNRKVLIAGVESIFGQVLSIILAEEGMGIGLLGSSKSFLEQLSGRLRVYGGSIAVGQAVSRDICQMSHAIHHIKNQLGFIDTMINIADPLMLRASDWRHGAGTNGVAGIDELIQAVLPEMIDNQRGDIINITPSSLCDNTKAPLIADLITMSESLQQEVRGYNIRVTSLTPPAVNTEKVGYTGWVSREENTVRIFEDMAEEVLSQLRICRPSTIKRAEVCTF